MNQPNWQDEINEDKAAKKQLVAEYISSKCESYSNVEEFQKIGACLSKGSKLEVTILTGGVMNYSYKISCRDADTQAEHRLFAKLSFAYSVTDPNKAPASLDRAETEYEMLSTFQKLSPGSAPTPYFCDNIEGDMKLLVCQWSPVEEQLSNQFARGAVDFRTAKKLAEGISKLHLVDEFDPEDSDSLSQIGEEEAKSGIDGLITELCKPERQDRVGALARDLGKDALAHMYDALFSYAFKTKDCLIHGDMHCLNVLGAGKPNGHDESTDDESSGDVVLIDWEMSRVGCAGQDSGALRPIPTACAFVHSSKGNHLAAEDCLAWFDEFWSAYEASMRDHGTSEDKITKIFRYSLQASTWYLWAMASGTWVDMLPVDKGTDDFERIKISCGVLFLKCLELGANVSLTLQELKDNYNEAVEEELNWLIPRDEIKCCSRSCSIALERCASGAQFHSDCTMSAEINTII